MLTKSDALDKFGAAMAKVQEAIGGAVKGNLNPHFKSKYADLTAVWETWQAIGPANGFSVMQFPGRYDAEAKCMGMDQIVIHSSGQWVQSELSIPLSKADAQAYGSANTYARRYSLAAAVGICPEDDDGNAASQGRREPEPDEVRPRKKPDEAIQRLIAGINSAQTVKGLYEWKALNHELVKALSDADYKRLGALFASRETALEAKAQQQTAGEFADVDADSIPY